jgi:hypothetical protein
MQDFPVSVIEWTQKQLGQYGRLGATRVVKVPDLPAPIPATTGSLAQAPLLTWRDPGTVISLYAQELSGLLPKFAQTDVRLQFSGDEDLITNGSAGDFAPLLALVGPNTNWFPITRRVKRGDVWTVTYRNSDPSGISTAYPSMLFAFIADADLGRAARDMAQQGQ